MDAVVSWLMANWVQLLMVLVVVDQVLIGIFPQVAFFGSLKDILTKLIGQKPQV